MKARELALTAMLCLGVVAAPMTQAQDAPRLNRKIEQVMLLNQILPVLFTREQLQAILPAIEGARQAEQKLSAEELKVLRRNETKMDTAIAAGRKQHRIPSNDEMAPIKSMISSLSMARRALVISQSDKVRVAMQKVCNRGQIKAAANSFDPRWFDRTLDPEKMSEDEKLRLFVQLVLLDPEAYPLLVDLSR